MAVKLKLDPETKIELLIKLAFGIAIDELAKEYDLTRAKIINLRKNNYLTYNEFLNHWRIDRDVAMLGLAPKFERAVSILKKFYKDKITIENPDILYKGKVLSITQIVNMADEILQKDYIFGFKDMPIIMKNNY